MVQLCLVSLCSLGTACSLFLHLRNGHRNTCSFLRYNPVEGSKAYKMLGDFENVDSEVLSNFPTSSEAFRRRRGVGEEVEKENEEGEENIAHP